MTSAMRQRVEEPQRRGGLPGVEVDVAALEREHEDRTRWLTRYLDRPASPHSWSCAQVQAAAVDHDELRTIVESVYLFDAPKLRGQRVALGNGQ